MTLIPALYQVIPRAVKVAAVLLLALLMVLLVVLLRRCSGPGPRPPTRVSTAAQVNTGKPVDTKPTIPQRIATVAIQPSGSAAAPRAAIRDIEAFCRAAGFTDESYTPTPAVSGAASESSITVPHATPSSEPQTAGRSSLAYISAGDVSPHRLILWTDHTNGNAAVDTFGIRRRVRFTRSGDSLVVRGPRFPNFGDALPVLECGTGMAVSGSIWRVGEGWISAIPGALLCLDGIRRSIW